MKNHDDEGLIDLRALSVPPRHGASATSAAFSFASEPPPPPGAFARDATATAGWAAHKKTIGLGAAAAAFLVLGCFGVAFAFRGEQAVKPPIAITNTLAAAPRTAAPVVAAPVPAPAPETAASNPGASSSEDDDDSSSDAKPKKKARKGGHAGQSHAGAGAGARSSAPAPVKHVKASDPCHCRGDFQCNIRCSANFKK